MSVPVNNLAVSSFYSKEEREELIKINQQYLEEIKKAQSGGDQQDAIKSTEKADRLLKELYERVKKRYIDHFKGDMDAILADVSAILQVVKKEHFQDEIRTIKFLTPKEEEVIEFYKDQPEPQRNEKIQRAKDMIKANNKAAVANYENCYNFLLLYLDVQIEALQQYGLPLSGLEELTAARASEWYTKVDTQQILPHTKQLRKLEKFLYLDDDITTRIFNGERNIKTPNGTIVMVDLDELEGVKISKELTLYEEFVWQTCVNLIVQDNHEILTVEQIYKAMGNPGRPTPSIKEEILEAVKIASRTRVSIDTAAEISKYPNTDRISAEFQLLDTEIVTAYSRGKIVKNGIKILGVPKLYTFAANRKQVSCLPASILEVPVSKTKQTIPLLNYLVQRILRMKNDKTAPKEILLDNLFLQCRIDSKSKRSRLLNEKNGTLRAILDHFISNGFIKEYRISSRDIEITI